MDHLIFWCDGMMDFLLRQTIVENQQLSSEGSSLLNGVSWDLTSLGYAENSRWTITLNNSPPPANHQSSSLDVDQMIGHDMVPLSENPNKKYTNVGVRQIPALIIKELLWHNYAKGKGLSPNPETRGSDEFKTFWNKHLEPHRGKKMCPIRGEFFEKNGQQADDSFNVCSHFEGLIVAMSGFVGTGNLSSTEKAEDGKGGGYFISLWDYRDSPYQKYLEAARIPTNSEKLQTEWPSRMSDIILLLKAPA